MKGELNVRREGKKRDCHFCGNCNSTPPDAVSIGAIKHHLENFPEGGRSRKGRIHSALKSKKPFRVAEKKNSFCVMITQTGPELLSECQSKIN